MEDGARSAEVAGNAPAPSLRDWLDHLAARGLLAVARPGAALRFELAAIAKHLDGVKATLFPSPGGHAMPVVSGLVSNRAWIADALGVPPREVLGRQECVHRDIDLGALLP